MRFELRHAALLSIVCIGQIIGNSSVLAQSLAYDNQTVYAPSSSSGSYSVSFSDEPGSGDCGGNTLPFAEGALPDGISAGLYRHFLYLYTCGGVRTVEQLMASNLALFEVGTEFPTLSSLPSLWRSFVVWFEAEIPAYTGAATAGGSGVGAVAVGAGASAGLAALAAICYDLVAPALGLPTIGNDGDYIGGSMEEQRARQLRCYDGHH